jgi:hypothetical protein
MMMPNGNSAVGSIPQPKGGVIIAKSTETLYEGFKVN